MRISDWSSDVCSSDLVDRVLRDRQKKPLVVRRVEGVHSPSDLARTVETIGWVPVDSTVRVSDVPNIVGTLGGSKLYGDGAAAPIRELIQNGLDAITARRRLQGRPPKWGELQVARSEEHTSELQSLMRISYAVFCLKKKT